MLKNAECWPNYLPIEIKGDFITVLKGEELDQS